MICSSELQAKHSNRHKAAVISDHRSKAKHNCTVHKDGEETHIIEECSIHTHTSNTESLLML